MVELVTFPARFAGHPIQGKDMKILMILAVLIVVAGFALGDPILTVLGAVSLACAVVDALAHRYSAQQPVQA